jgi:hypothetical protein
MSFNEAVDRELEWHQPETLRRFYQLTFDGREFATLRFEKLCGSLASGECGQRQWTFKRTGFLSPRVSVREAGSETDVALFTPSWTGSGWVAFASGRRYQLGQRNFWGTEWVFKTEDGSDTVSLSGPHGLFKAGGTARVAQSATALPETPVLLLLIWYLRVLMNEDAGAAAVVVACG